VKENSIEEDIKIIENFINWLTIDFEYDSGNEIKTIEHILSDYKRVLKENEELKAEMKDGVIAIKLYALQKENEGLKNQEATARKINELLVQRYSNSISLQKVKDKIEELNRKIDKSIDDSKGGLDEEFIEKAGELLAQKRILQELLESEK
jgi:hypothetical protein